VFTSAVSLLTQGLAARNGGFGNARADHGRDSRCQQTL
jgi:hypothetical protein